MPFTKQDLFEELRWFMPCFAHSVGRMFNAKGPAAPRVGPYREFGVIERAMLHIEGDKDEPNWEVLQNTWLWSALSTMYDYAFEGIVTPETNIGDGEFADVELFIKGLEGLGQYMEEDEGGIPRKCLQTVTLAVARHVLDGGDPYQIDPDRPSGYLTFGEIALLADMDERSVRNAANPKLPNPLKTETIGKRSLIAVEEARRWLTGRKGYVPTKPLQQKAPAFMFAAKVQLSLPSEIVSALEKRAGDQGMSREEFLRSLLSREVEEVLQGRAALAATLEAARKEQGR